MASSSSPCAKSSLMASSSSSSSCTWKYRVFTSFHGPDVRKTFFSHLQKQFSYNGITMFDDQGIERSQLIAPALRRAIQDSRILIVLLSKNYASSSWCLDELLEIMKCKEVIGKMVMTVFYGVDPSDVQKQTGDFGIAFNETCASKTEEERRNWSQALTYVSNIAGEHFKNWENEAEMIEKIARDVSDKLNATPSRDFDGMVGLEAHLRKMENLLDLDDHGSKIVGISSPAGIGKSTIARALHSQLSNRFQRTCFMENLREKYKIGIGEYGVKLRLQELFLSKILNQNGMRISHLGVIKERLYDQRVLIILDDVESLDQLEALADIMWFGPGSRVIVTTENKEILHQHGMSDIYQVGFPSEIEAQMMFCLSTFRQTYPPDGFLKLTDEVVRICGNLPLSLHVVGSSLRGKTQVDWTDELPRLKNCLDGKIESVLKAGYESLHEKDQALFLHIAVFFNYEHVDHVTSMLAQSNLDVRFGLKVLANRYLIHIDYNHESRVVIHRLLQVMARQVISKQDPSKRQILVDAQEISYVLENAAGNGSILGVSFDVTEINDLMISARAFERICNLVFLKVYSGRHSRERLLHISEEMELPPRLRLLYWEAYPRKSLPLRFCPEYLVKLNMVYSQLENLWQGTQLLANLKEMNFSRSSRLKKLPDLSNATNLEKLNLFECISLVELPSSIVNLQKLVDLEIHYCRRLEVMPTLINFASLKEIKMVGCSLLRNFPDIPTNTTKLVVTETAIEEFPSSLRHCSRLKEVSLSFSGNLKTFATHLPTSVTELDLCFCDIESITDCIKGLHNLQVLFLDGCKRLVSLPELPNSLHMLIASNCESLERVSGPLNTPKAELCFTNCFKLDQHLFLQKSFAYGHAILPGRKVPAWFDHRAKGNSLTIPHSAFFRFRVCVVVSPNHQAKKFVGIELLHCSIVIDDFVNSADMNYVTGFKAEHLFMFHINLPLIDPSKVSRKIVLKFSSTHQDHDIIECGIQILTDNRNGSNNGGSGDEDDSSDLMNPTKLHTKKRKKMMVSLTRDLNLNPSKRSTKKTMKRCRNHKFSQCSRSFHLALVLRSRRKATPSKHYRRMKKKISRRL